MGEFTPQEDSELLWETALEAIKELAAEKRAGKASQLAAAWVHGQWVSTVPAGSEQPEEISMHYDYDGNFRDVYRTLTLTAAGARSLHYSNIHWGSGEDEDPADQDYVFGPASPDTLDWMARLAADIRAQKPKNN